MIEIITISSEYSEYERQQGAITKLRAEISELLQLELQLQVVYPSGVKAPIQYKSSAVYMSVYQYETIRERVASSEVAGSDETACRVNGRKQRFMYGKPFF